MRRSRMESLRNLLRCSWLMALLLVLSSSRAGAQCDYTVPLGLSLTANFNTINIHVPLACDENHTATATVRYWKTSDGGSQADVGHPLVIDPIRNQLNGK